MAKKQARTSLVKEPIAARTMQIERLGKTITWSVPTAPYADNKNRRSAFVGGFETRVQQINSGAQGAGVPQRFPYDTEDQRAFEDGYHDAARQDGTDLKPKGLEGSNGKRARGR